MERLLAEFPAAVRAEFSGLWQELGRGATAEAQFVKQVDRLETFLQSRHYWASLPDLPVDSFRREVIATIDDPLLGALRDAALENDASTKD